jgi:hypothetical protein
VELNLEATSNPSFPNISDVQQKDEIIYFQTQYRDNFLGDIILLQERGQYSQD